MSETPGAIETHWFNLLSDRAIGELHEIRFVRIAEVRFQVAIGCRQRIDAVVGQHDRLRVLQLRKDLCLEHLIPLQVVGQRVLIVALYAVALPVGILTRASWPFSDNGGSVSATLRSRKAPARFAR